MLQKTGVKRHFSSNKKIRKFKGFEFPRELYIAEGYEISIGGSQPDARSCALTGKKTQLLQIGE